MDPTNEQERRSLEADLAVFRAELDQAREQISVIREGIRRAVHEMMMKDAGPRGATLN